MKEAAQIKLPEKFRYLMWSYNFSKIDVNEYKERIIINTINYGQWYHLKWIIHYFGTVRLKRIIQDIPVSEFRNRAGLELICLLLGIKKMKYANRGIKIKAKRAV